MRKYLGPLMLAVMFTLAMCMFSGCAGNSSNSAGTSASGSSASASTSAASTSAAAADIAGDYDGSALSDVRFASMKGATSVGLAYLMQNEWGQFTVVSAADEVASMLMQDKVDIACVPANLAATLYQKTDGQIRVLDVNTLGVLYVVTKDDAIHTIDNLKGRTIYMTGKGTVPEYTINALLKAYSIAPEDVTIEFKSEPSEVAALVADNAEAVGILPQPFATALTMKDADVKQAIDLSQVWKDVMGDTNGQITTGVTIAKASYVDQNPQLIADFLQGAGVSAKVAEQNPDAIAQTVVDLGIIDNLALAQASIPKCNVVCLTGFDMQAALEGYLGVLFDEDPASIGRAMPGQDFYYNSNQ